MPNPPSPRETLEAARQALVDLSHGIEDEPELSTAPVEIAAALDLLDTLTAEPEGEREREIEGRLDPVSGRTVRASASQNVAIHARDDLRYLLTQLRAARARVTEVEGERDEANERASREATVCARVAHEKSAAVVRADAAEKDRDTARAEVAELREALTTTREDYTARDRLSIRLRMVLADLVADCADTPMVDSPYYAAARDALAKSAEALGLLTATLTPTNGGPDGR